MHINIFIYIYMVPITLFLNFVHLAATDYTVSTGGLVLTGFLVVGLDTYYLYNLI